MLGIEGIMNTKINRKQAIVWHWTTVPYGKDQHPYEFPESSDHVKIIYVYHDSLFSTFSIVTRENGQDNVVTESIPIDLSFRKDIPPKSYQMQTQQQEALKFSSPEKKLIYNCDEIWKGGRRE